MGVSLTEFMELQEMPLDQAKKWLGDNIVAVMKDIGAVHNLEMGYAELHGLLTSQKMTNEEKIQEGIKFLKDHAP